MTYNPNLQTIADVFNAQGLGLYVNSIDPSAIDTREPYYPQHFWGDRHGDHEIPYVSLQERMDSWFERTSDALATSVLVTGLAGILFTGQMVVRAEPAGNLIAGPGVLDCGVEDDIRLIGYPADFRFTEAELPELTRQAQVAGQTALDELGELDLGGVERGVTDFLGDADDPSEMGTPDLVCRTPKGDYRISGNGQISLLDISRAGIELDPNRQTGTYFTDFSEEPTKTYDYKDLFGPEVKRIRFAA